MKACLYCLAFCNRVPANFVHYFSSCVSNIVLCMCLYLQKKRTAEVFIKNNKQPPTLTLSCSRKKHTPEAGPDLRFTRVAICMLRPINFSWLSHYEHSQPEGGNAKLIRVLKLLSQASITGKCSDYPPGTRENHI